MHHESTDTPPTRSELDQYVRELRRLTSARKAPEPPAGRATAPGKAPLSRQELRALRRSGGRDRRGAA